MRKPPPIGHDLRDLIVEHVSTVSLTPHRNNPRLHSKKQIRQIADSIVTFGWTNPVLVDANGGVIAGHGRIEAAKLLGLDHIPVIRIEDMTEAQKRAYILADNKLAENAGWDHELLALELQGLLEMELDFELTATGFEMGEIDMSSDSSPRFLSPTISMIWNRADRKRTSIGSSVLG